MPEGAVMPLMGRVEVVVFLKTWCLADDGEGEGEGGGSDARPVTLHLQCISASGSIGS